MSRLMKVTFKLLDLLVILAMTLGSPMSALAAGGSYTINFAAADPADYIPPVPYPESVTPIVGRGNGDSEIPAAWFTKPGGADTKVESLTPDDMALGQVVPFEIRITVTGATTPENGVITFVAGWNIDTSSNDLFGYDPSYGVIAAFIDTGDGSFIDPEGDATVSNYTWEVVGDEIQGTFTVSGLDQGDKVVLEAWLVLDETIPSKATGNVPSRLISAQTAAGDTISTGNQTVPLLQVGDFFNSDVDVSVTKTDSPDPVMKGDQLTYTLAVSNAGPNIANNVIVTDTLDPNTSFVSATASDPMATCSHAAGVVTCDLGAVVPGVPVTITITVLVAETAPTAGTTSTGTCTVGGAGVDLCNRVSVSTISDDTNTADNSDSEPTDIPAFIPNPVINVEKSSTTASITAAGQSVPYTFVITNTGNVTLTGVTVTDAMCDAAPVLDSGDANTDGKLDLTENWTYTCSHTVTQDEIDAGGNLSNTVTADSNESEPDTDSYSIPISQNAAMTVEKSSTTTSLSAPGTVDYSYLVKNTGNVTLTAIVLSDDNDEDDMSCPATTLAVGTSMTCTATHTFTQDELDAGGTLDNIVTADSNETMPVTDSLSIPITKTAAIIVVKASTTVEVVEAGQVVPYTFTVDNEGNVTLTGITVSDPMCDAVPAYVSGDTNGDNKLQVNETWVYTCNHTVTQAEIDANGGGDGDLDNTVTADSNESTEDTDDHAILIDYNPAMTVAKSSTTSSLSAPATVTYSYLVTNTGNVTLTSIALSDNNDNNDMVCESDTLAPEAKMTCTATHTFTQAELDAGGTLDNVVMASSEEAPDATDSLSIPISQNASITVDKSSTTTEITIAGQVVPYSFVVTNTGNVTLTNITVTDPMCNAAPALQSGDANNDGKLQVNETWTYTCSHTVTQAEVDAGGNLSNTVTAESNETGPATDTLNIPISQKQAILVVKASTTILIAKAGEVVPYTFEVTNAGNVTLSGITVSDAMCDVAPVFVSGDTNGDNKLQTTEKWLYTCDHTVTQAEVDSKGGGDGDLDNTVTADSTESPPATDDHAIPITYDPKLNVAKTSTTTEITIAGQVIPYTFVVTNTGNVTLTGVTVTDAMCDAAPVLDSGDANTDAKLQLDETWTYTCSHTVTQDEIDAGGNLSNTVTVASNESAPDTDTKDIPIKQSAAIIVVKASTTTQIAKAGDVVPYTFEVTNDGNVTLSGITVSDPKCDAAPVYKSGDSNTDSKLQTTEKWLYTCSHTVTQAEVDSKGGGDGDLDNTVTADSNESLPDDDSLAIPITYDPKLNVAKSSTTTEITAVGQAVPYKFVVTNTGNVTLTGVTVTDAMCDAAPVLDSGDTDQDNELDLGETWTYTCNHTVTQDELDAGGNLSNTVTVASNESGPDTDTKDIPIKQSAAILVVKASTTTLIAKAGDVVPYTFTVTNKGNVTLTGITVNDPMCNAAPVLDSGDTNNDAKLQTTETWIYKCSHTVTQAEVDSKGGGDGDLDNTVTADSNESLPDDDSMAIPITYDPKIDVEKSISIDGGQTWSDADATPGPSVTDGSSVQFKFVVTNTGNVTLTGITLTDSDFDLSTCSKTDPLAPTKSFTCMITVTAVAGQHTNTATAGSSQSGPDTDDANYFGMMGNQPSIAIRSLSISINKTRTIVTGQFYITDESEAGTRPDGFLVSLTTYGVRWEQKSSAKRSVFAPVTPSGCTYTIVSVDYQQAAGWKSGDPIIFDETVTIDYTCTFGSTELLKGGTLKGTAYAEIFNRTDKEFTYSRTAAIPK